MGEKERERITGRRGNIGKREERFIIYQIVIAIIVFLQFVELQKESYGQVPQVYYIIIYYYKHIHVHVFLWCCLYMYM